VLGEEFGANGSGERRWILDPIDATKKYIRGIPVFATLIALDSTLGVISAPALGRRWWALREGGAFCNGQAIHVSTVRDLPEAQIGHSSLIDLAPFGLDEKCVDPVRPCGGARGFGSSWIHRVAAEGAFEIALEPL